MPRQLRKELGQLGWTETNLVCRPKSDPAKRGIVATQSRQEIDRRPGNKLGHPIIGYSQELWAGYRRYADPTIEGAVSTLKDPMTDEIELHVAIWEFFGYPRRIIPVKANPAAKPLHRATTK